MKFDYFQERARARKGATELEQRLPQVHPKQRLTEYDDAFYLAEMTRGIFRAGFVWRIIDNKWADFQAAFSGFVPLYWQQVPPERLEQLADDPRIVRNWQKIETVPVNARMIVEVAEEHGSFGNFLAHWPSSDQAGLLDYFKVNGARLAGATAQHFLRRVGWDGFVLSADVVTALKNHNLMDASPTSKRGMRQAQQAFNQWHEETGLPYSHLSRIVSMTVDAAAAERKPRRRS
ncbi:DNA-3-methyladenine glycosylase I [Pseudidiomarina sp. 1APP75-32.1]|uniref:DNA-3-methyladenine glycosylase I n=1 Tax=Pseudidiomarina terrestris TaxID=2820060 RepID=A0AAW7R2K9_9GAMM|nr:MULTISPECIES: DNA-3-methyladenine glycosylase I [unclassified Pseudidiomarina]MDN7124996.1 DNA-3-methyladenine glycosylase I [Pseudidiomarina sp. 1APP75-32.1]MDN7129529.1 DNA-3-methyladenine glycosylase I [Pseudidiomarina sp. 1APR75-15]MDN7138216.1 DNA-3-methyladenine glycosylase I [Pseudidiomarina sp. 1ASP75-14]